MTFLSSLGLRVAARLAYKLVEKQQWLPKSVYHQMALDKLRHGELGDAKRFNDIALRKKPDYEKALVMHDVLAMRRDAMLAYLRRDIQQEEQAIANLAAEQQVLRRTLSRHNFWRAGLQILPWLFAASTLAVFFGAFWFFRQRHDLLLGGLAGGLGVALTFLTLQIFLLYRDNKLNRALQQRETTAALAAQEREFNLRARRLRRLQNELAQAQHLFRVKKDDEISEKL